MEAVEAKCGGCERGLLSRGVGWEAGKGQQAQARKNLGGRALNIADNEQHAIPTAHYHNGVLLIMSRTQPPLRITLGEEITQEGPLHWTRAQEMA